MNKVFLIGNLTRDPELTETASGVKICRFSIAVNRYAGNGERKADFYNCTAFRNTADVVGRIAKKGHKVAISGSIELRDYEDNQGNRRTAVDIIAQDVEFLTPRSSSSEYDEYSEPSQPTSNGRAKPQLQPFDDEGDIPF